MVILKDPLTAEEHLRLGSIYELRGEIDLAVKEYQSALSMDKENTKALFFLGNAYFGMDDLEKAESFYKRVLEVDTDYQQALIYNNLAWVYIKGGRNLDEGARLSREAIKLDPKNSSIYLDTLGVIYISQREYALAEQTLLKAIEKASDQNPAFRAEVITHLSEVYKAMEKDIEENGYTTGRGEH